MDLPAGARPDHGPAPSRSGQGPGPARPRPAAGAVAAGIARQTFELLVPRACPCGTPGPAPCAACARALAGPPRPVQESCPALVMVTGADAATGIVRTSPLFPVLALGLHAGALRDLVLAFKDHGELSLAPVLARALRGGLEELAPTPDAVVVPVPSTRAHRWRRGEDHTRLLARHMVRGTGLAVHPGLGLSGAGQVGRDRRARQARAASSRIRVPHGRTPPGTAVLLDDVVTTGSTLRAVAEALAAHGWRTAGALVIAAAREPRAPGGTRPHPVGEL